MSLGYIPLTVGSCIKRVPGKGVRVNLLLIRTLPYLWRCFTVVPYPYPYDDFLPHPTRTRKKQRIFPVLPEKIYHSFLLHLILVVFTRTFTQNWIFLLYPTRTRRKKIIRTRGYWTVKEILTHFSLEFFGLAIKSWMLTTASKSVVQKNN